MVLYSLSGSHSILEAKKIGLKTASEVFADRTYQADGSLTPRHLPNAVHHDFSQVEKQVKMMFSEKKVKTVDNQIIDIEVDTICIHGDTPNAVEFAKAVFNFF